jgi:hypothetical protein
MLLQLLLTETLELGVLLDYAGLMEQRDEWVVGSLDQEELKRVAVEGNAFQRREDGVEHSTASNYKSKS